PRFGQHLRTGVDADDLVPELGKVLGVAAGPARGVEGSARRTFRQQGPNVGLLIVDQRVRRLIIRRGPRRVAAAHIELRHLHPARGWRLANPVADAGDLPDSEIGLVWVADGPATKQREPLEPEEVLRQPDAWSRCGPGLARRRDTWSLELHLIHGRDGTARCQRGTRAVRGLRRARGNTGTFGHAVWRRSDLRRVLGDSRVL